MATADAVVAFFGGDDSPLEMTAERYAVEKHLEDLLVRSPMLLARNQMTPDDPRQWLLIRQQYPLRRHRGRRMEC